MRTGVQAIDGVPVTTRLAMKMEDSLQAFAVRAACFIGELEVPFSEEFDGHDYGATHVIAYIGDVVDPETRTIKIRCDVTNLDHKLKADMFVRIHIDVSQQTQALALPQSALIRMADKTFIFVQHNPEEYERREVVTGPILGEYIEIQGGVRSGERVVVKGGLLLQGELDKQGS